MFCRFKGLGYEAFFVAENKQGYVGLSYVFYLTLFLMWIYTRD